MGPAFADVGPPAHLRIVEADGGRVEVRWRVPKTLPTRAAPVPLLPADCTTRGDGSVEDLPSAWLFTREWECGSALAGQEIGLRYPFPDLALTTVARVELRSGDRFARLLVAGEPSWVLPQGTVAPDLLAAARRSVLAGADHALGGAHIAFLLVVGLLGSLRAAVRAASGFAAGQLAGIVVARLGLPLDAALAELGLALAVVLLAREALRPESRRRRVPALAVCGGLFHGAGSAALLASSLGENGSAVVNQLGALVGMDALHLTGAAIVAGVMARAVVMARAGGTAEPATPRRVAVYAAAAFCTALAIGLALDGGSAASKTALSAPPDATITPAASANGAGGRSSRRLASGADETALAGFLTVEPFEVRHEVMVRPGRLGAALGGPFDRAVDATLSPAEQPELLAQLEALVIEGTTLTVDGAPRAGTVRRAEFMTVDSTGALPRETPVPEALDAAVVGVVVVYATRAVPGEIVLEWTRIPPGISDIPLTTVDPEAVRTETLDASRPAATWSNTLSEEPTPALLAVAVEPVRLPLSLFGVPLLVVAVGLRMAALRSARGERQVLLARLALAAALVTAPYGRVDLPLPGSAGRTPSEGQARRILAGLLPNVYRAMEFRDEAVVYDRLAVSVSGDALTEIYLEQQRTLTMEERGGARVRVEAVEVREARDVSVLDRGFAVQAAWTVAGQVTHFGHRHFRQNRYDARVTVEPVDGDWKIRFIELLDQERLQ